MKKILVFILIMPFLALMTLESFAIQATKTLYIHYYRYDSVYTDWTFWLWEKSPNAGEGASFSLEKDDTDTTYNYGGNVAIIDLESSFSDATALGIIVRKGDWVQKDIDQDRFFEIPSNSPNGEHHIYLVEGDERIGISLTDSNGPDKSHKIKSAYFNSENTILIASTETLVKTNLKLFIDDVEAEVTSLESNQGNATLTFAGEVDFSKTYKIVHQFSDLNLNEYIVTYDGIYDSEKFNETYAYLDDDLGATITSIGTSFKLWAPISSKVILNLYQTGTPSTDPNLLEQIEMFKGEKGIFYYHDARNLHNTYYTYSVTNGTSTKRDLVDPYAKSTGVNGLRGLVVDFSKTNPQGYEIGNRANNITYATDAIIYELHVRDLTTHTSWNGDDKNRGKYLGLIEEGTTYNGYKTGFDHIKELGITHLQILPFYDFGVVDETRLNDPTYDKIFNWGYMPLHFNTLEGSYASDPYDGLVRIHEMKQVVKAYTDANIRINMDVVYNHTGLSADSNFNQIIPGYYHRMTDSNAYSNGSGTGNETASERIMVRKLIVDSTLFWATEYNISGFRFDLMALHDLETMNELTTKLHQIDETIMVYGEPWMGGTSTLSESLQSGKRNLHLIENVGAFNDDFRDGVKGSVFARGEGGFIQGNLTQNNIERVKYGIVGGISHPSVNANSLTISKVWHQEPTKTINYVTAHDNNTLHDKLYQTLEESNKLHLIDPLMKQANALVLTSQGIPFLHAGDEFARSKPAANGRGFDHNSYESPDSVNQMRWDLKGEYLSIYNYYKGLIELRKNESLFRLESSQKIIDALAFVYTDKKEVLVYTLSNENKTMLIIHHVSETKTRITLPKNGGWNVLVNDKNAGTETLVTLKGGEPIRLNPNTSYVMVQDTSIPDYQYNYLPIILIVGGLALVGTLSFIVIKFKKNTQSQV